jgi:hypothetical protein
MTPVGAACTVPAATLRRVRRPSISKTTALLLVAFVVVGALLTDASPFALVVAALAAWLLFKVGFTILGGLAQPVPEPPPAGELRKVKIMYRCTVCGTEVRMTTANDQMPEPPRHCMDEMELVTPVDDL